MRRVIERGLIAWPVLRQPEPAVAVPLIAPDKVNHLGAAELRLRDDEERAARLAVILVGESPTSIGVQSML
jgi:hypothetical protein